MLKNYQSSPTSNSKGYFVSLSCTQSALPRREESDYKLVYKALFSKDNLSTSAFSANPKHQVSRVQIPEHIVEKFPSRQVQPYSPLPEHMRRSSATITRHFELLSPKLCASFAIYVIGEYAILRNYHPSGGTPDLFKDLPKLMVAADLKMRGVKYATLEYEEIHGHDYPIDEKIRELKAKNKFYPIDQVIGKFSMGEPGRKFGPPLLENPLQ